MDIYFIPLASFIASFLTLFTGFGLGTILMPVMALSFPVPLAVAMTALVHLINNILKAALLIKHIDRRTLAAFGLPALVAAVPGALLLDHLSHLPDFGVYTLGGVAFNPAPMKLTAGLLLIFFATADWLPVMDKIGMARLPVWISGSFSGFFGGLTGHQGAFRSAFLIDLKLSKESFIATGAAIAAVVDITRLIVYGVAANLLLQAEQHHGLMLAACLASFLGVVAGTLGLKKITVVSLQRTVVAGLYLLGVLLCLGLA